MTTKWKLVKVCGKCLQQGHSKATFCEECGGIGMQSVLKRYIVKLFRVDVEYKKYAHCVNPFEDKNLNL